MNARIIFTKTGLRGAARLLLLAGVLAAPGLRARAVPAPADSLSKSNAAPALSNAVPAEAIVPKSVFIIPSSPPEGKDPFFPRSTRVYATSVIVNTNPAVVAAPVLELHLNGISGTAAHPLAIINYRTFELGEEGELTSPNGRTRVRILDIKPDFVLVQIGGERRMLRLRGGI